jgi:hypothetical protein
MQDSSTYIRTYGPDGMRGNSMSLSSLLWHESEKRVYLNRNARTGKVISGHFLGCDERYYYDTHPFKTVPTGKYTKGETVGDYRIIQHKPLPYRAIDAATGYVHDPHSVDRFVRALFSGVANSCLVSS